MEGYRLLRPCFAGIPVKRDTRRRSEDGIRAGMRWSGGLQSDLNFPSASDLSRVRNKVACARLQRVIALAFFAVNADGHIFEEISAAFLKFRGARRSHRVNRTLALDF